MNEIVIIYMNISNYFPRFRMVHDPEKFIFTNNPAKYSDCNLFFPPYVMWEIMQKWYFTPPGACKKWVYQK